jgi:hypothetical protein
METSRKSAVEVLFDVIVGYLYIYGLFYNNVSICDILIKVNRTGELEIIWKEAVMA